MCQPSPFPRPVPSRTHVPSYISGSAFTALSIVGFIVIVLLDQAVDPELGGFLLLFDLMPLGFGLALLSIGAYVHHSAGGRDV
ncbi:hypothetical protein [Virgisporangium aurantiacum]|uniref:Uncharacterized protein n=1 Tax=Virgisporangium aurantiacum TaxID=175570 RepID=A0A8J3Z0T7_9ACTN|nr:hypothetical protein [Virgisporangium aurantiacum]GIJ53235.1 hypothetical protein Vau01_007510 [Virgisporangium aurantiacum]